jgi:hypothetical protein
MTEAMRSKDSSRVTGRSTMFANQRKYCSSCWRDEMHVPARSNVILQAAMILLTLGIAYLLWPFRCTCCGHLRPNRITSYAPFLKRKLP